MALTGPDRDWLDGKFNVLHKRVTDSEKEQTKIVSKLETKLIAHLAAPCGDVENHEKRYHLNGAKRKLTMVVLIFAALTGGLALLVFIIQAIVNGASI